MMRCILLLVMSLGSLCAYGGDTAFPWEELKELYREKIAAEFREEAVPPDGPSVIALDEVRYRLHVGMDRIAGEIDVNGRLISGEAMSLPLLGPETVLRATETVLGAHLLPDGATGGTLLMPERGAESFQVHARFLARATEERGAQGVTLSIPQALICRVHVELEDGLRLLEAPGIGDEAGDYFVAGDAIHFRYGPVAAMDEIQVPEIDLFTVVSVRQHRLVFETHGIPQRGLATPAALRLPEGSTFVQTTLHPSVFSREDGATILLEGPLESRTPFVVESTIALAPDGGPTTFSLPYLDGNTGREGRFIVRDPEDGQVVVTGEQLVSQVPLTQLGDSVTGLPGSFFMRTPIGQAVTLSVTRFTTEHVRETVLERQAIQVVFDETGRSLSTLYLEVPADAGPRLVLDPIPEAEVWSLTVNGQVKQVYTDVQGGWVIPLGQEGSSVVELAFLQEGEPVGLYGSLEVLVPRTNLAARTLYVGVSLPSRVELLSFDGPVKSAGSAAGERPPFLENAPYVFTQPFYKGEGMKVTIAYKEPVNGKKEGN